MTEALAQVLVALIVTAGGIFTAVSNRRTQNAVVDGVAAVRGGNGQASLQSISDKLDGHLIEHDAARARHVGEHAELGTRVAAVEDGLLTVRLRVDDVVRKAGVDRRRADRAARRSAPVMP